MQVIHRDIKPSNIVVSGSSDNLQLQDIQLKINDFNISLDLDQDEDYSQKNNLFVTKASYRAPEAWFKLKYSYSDKAIDVWSLGNTTPFIHASSSSIVRAPNQYINHGRAWVKLLPKMSSYPASFSSFLDMRFSFFGLRG